MKFILLLVVALVAGTLFRDNIVTAFTNGNESINPEKSTMKGNHNTKSEADIVIIKKWDLPSKLKEVSGIAYMDKERFACVQDEEGSIFIFNRSSQQIEKQIPFAGSGDYEGITLNGSTAYIIRADGVIFEVDMKEGKASAKEYKTSLTAKQDIEGIFYDKKKNRLLLSVKNDEPGKVDYKGIYAFDLANKNFIKEAVFKIDMKHKTLNKAGQKKKDIMPSAIGIHPVSNEIFIADGPNSRLLVLDPSGNIKDLYQLGNDFPQPEGITFSPDGEIFIANEGKKDKGNIIQVKIAGNSL